MLYLIAAIVGLVTASILGIVLEGIVLLIVVGLVVLALAAGLIVWTLQLRRSHATSVSAYAAELLRGSGSVLHTRQAVRQIRHRHPREAILLTRLQRLAGILRQLDHPGDSAAARARARVYWQERIVGDYADDLAHFRSAVDLQAIFEARLAGLR